MIWHLCLLPCARSVLRRLSASSGRSNVRSGTSFAPSCRNWIGHRRSRPALRRPPQPNSRVSFLARRKKASRLAPASPGSPPTRGLTRRAWSLSGD
eukprot:4488810-Pyramimonas_sp.AAC.1